MLGCSGCDLARRDASNSPADNSNALTSRGRCDKPRRLSGNAGYAGVREAGAPKHWWRATSRLCRCRHAHPNSMASMSLTTNIRVHASELTISSTTEARQSSMLADLPGDPLAQPNCGSLERMPRTRAVQPIPYDGNSALPLEPGLRRLPGGKLAAAYGAGGRTRYNTGAPPGPRALSSSHGGTFPAPRRSQSESPCSSSANAQCRGTWTDQDKVSTGFADRFRFRTGRQAAPRRT